MDDKWKGLSFTECVKKTMDDLDADYYIRGFGWFLVAAGILYSLYDTFFG